MDNLSFKWCSNASPCLLSLITEARVFHRRCIPSDQKMTEEMPHLEVCTVQDLQRLMVSVCADNRFGSLKSDVFAACLHLQSMIERALRDRTQGSKGPLVSVDAGSNSKLEVFLE